MEWGSADVNAMIVGAICIGRMNYIYVLAIFVLVRQSMALNTAIQPLNAPRIPQKIENGVD